MKKEEMKKAYKFSNGKRNPYAKKLKDQHIIKVNGKETTLNRI